MSTATSRLHHLYTDTDLENQMTLLKNRDEDFLSFLFSSINPGLMGMLAGHGIFKESAEEITHECWETFFINIDKFAGRSQLKTYLFGILLNKIREYRRKIKKIDYKEDSEEIFSASFTNEGWWAQDPGDPEKIFKNKQLGLAIEDCLEGLSEVQKSAFMLIESEGESTEEACNILGVTSTHLRVLIFRAKNKLKTCLEGRVA